MSEQPPEAPAQPETPVDNSSTEAKRYAAFDKTYEKFLPGVFETKAAASKAAKGFKGDVGDVEIREV